MMDFEGSIPRYSISTSMANTGNTGDRFLHQQSNIDLSRSTAHIHAVFGFIISALIALVSLKYLGSGTNPFETRPRIMLLFISASFGYTIAVLAETMIGGADNCTSNLFRYMYLISGSLACELLGFVLVGPFCLLLMNLSALVVAIVVLLRRFNLQIQTFNQLVATIPRQQFTDTPQDVAMTTEVSHGQVGEVQSIV